ncbi:MAG TPA: DUF1223 domain-containing protein [Caldimonas sp.]|jgi:hypothetical protein|nr:DUF1223 domain-containing protein [Caldimonas sp.]HEX2541799.1 DUF1223 domain-containing protein [Caldimonas sp.]
MKHPHTVLGALVAGLAAGAPGLVAAAEACVAASPRTVVPVVELYTSEGCNSCPPADRWLSALKSSPDVVALAFHVDYWDRLGWKDRYGSAAFTQRQASQLASTGARFSYTPQVVVDGQDRKDWPSLRVPAAARPPATIELSLAREGERVVATVTPGPGAPRRLAAYWTVTEQAHVTAVKAGENEGATLRHDFVVREYATVPPWSARGATPETLHFTPAGKADAAHPRSVNLVVVDAATGRPVQALKLAC